MVDDPTRYKLKEAVKLENTLSSEVGMSVSIPLKKLAFMKFTLDVGLNLSIDNFPTVSYYSVEDKRFYPVEAHPTTSMLKFLSWPLRKLGQLFDDVFGDDEAELRQQYRRMQDVYGAGSVAGIDTKMDVPGLGRYNYYYDDTDDGNGGFYHSQNAQNNMGQGLCHYGLGDFDNNYAKYIIGRHPRLGEKIQRNICTFTLNFNDGVQNFDDGVQFRVPHYYPAGDLFGITEQGDTTFVVSEVINVTAFNGETELFKTQRGEFEITGNVGVDDLTPFGFPEDQPLDVYYSAPGSKTWQYVGPAGTPLKVDKLGAYMMGTSISNDTEAPVITALLDEETGLMHINITDNIGVRISSLQVLVNGEMREVSMINQSNFELWLTEEEMQYMVVVDITINDLADNEGRLFQIFNMDKPDNTEISNKWVEQKTDIRLNKRMLTVNNASPNAVVTVYAINGLVQAKAKTDADGHVEVNLNSLLEGVYIVTLSDGKSKKFYVR